jgi:hypothetical protein
VSALNIPEEQSELYVKALKALHTAGKDSDHTKPAETKEEEELMKQTAHTISQVWYSPPRYKDGQFELIFPNSLNRTAYVVDGATGDVDTIQVWESPETILQAYNESGSIA